MTIQHPLQSGGTSAVIKEANPGDRTRRWGWWYIAEHRVRQMRSYVGSFFIIGFGSPVLYLLGLGAGLALLVNQRQGAESVDGVGYLTFLAPALLLSGSMLAASQENTYGVFGGFKWNPIFEAMNSSPISPRQIVVGFTLGTLARVVPAASFFLIVMYAFGIVHGFVPILLLVVAALLATSVGLCVMAWVATQRDDRGQLSFIERFLITPLTLFSGTYFPLDTLPIGLQWIGWVSPLWHAVELGRGVGYGAESELWLTGVHIAYLLFLAALGFLISCRVFAKRLDK
ncbi:ABC transporter permease [Humidisolicoccus flavus]|uniref:ABC transporter permease n=1 Tax=Humidisolicoccus flavus TaxID=3111414 RepID=UPI00324CB771